MVAPTGSDFRHEALLYSSEAEFLDGTMDFIRAAITAREPVLVVVDAAKIALLQAVLGEDAQDVLFADMATVGRNPAQIIPAWRSFVDQHAGSGQHVRGIGEPIGPTRGPIELVECRHHEALLNLAFADTPGFWLLCPYDTAVLDPMTVEEAHRTHPFVRRNGHHGSGNGGNGVGHASALYDGTKPAELLSEPLSEPPGDAEEHPIGPSLASLRRFVADQAMAAGLDPRATGDVVLAVDEVATNSLRYGGGHGLLRMWQQADALVCEVRDNGHITDPLVGRRRPTSDQPQGRGLWMVNQVCDVVQLRSSPTAGSVVRLHVRIPQ